MKRHERRFAELLRKHIAIYGEVRDSDLKKLLLRAGVELHVPYARVPHGTRCARCHRRLTAAMQEWAHNVYGPTCYQIVARGEEVA